MEPGTGGRALAAQDWRARCRGKSILGRTPPHTPRAEDAEEMALYCRMKGRQEGHQAWRGEGARGSPAAIRPHPCPGTTVPLHSTAAPHPHPRLQGPEQVATSAPCTHLPTKFSSTELLPALWPPTTAICGSSSRQLCPSAEKASCRRFTSGISSSISRFPILPAPPPAARGSLLVSASWPGAGPRGVQSMGFSQPGPAPTSDPAALPAGPPLGS